MSLFESNGKETHLILRQCGGLKNHRFPAHIEFEADKEQTQEMFCTTYIIKLYWNF
jgi:hypothetical protein